jgi:hypothetical protein
MNPCNMVHGANTRNGIPQAKLISAVLAYPPTQQSVNETDTGVLLFCIIKYMATCFVLQSHPHTVILNYLKRNAIYIYIYILVNAILVTGRGGL